MVGIGGYQKSDISAMPRGIVARCGASNLHLSLSPLPSIGGLVLVDFPDRIFRTQHPQVCPKMRAALGHVLDLNSVQPLFLA